jgi:hypothetical protein
MSAQQIKLTINDLVNHIEDEDKLRACFIVLATIAKGDKKQSDARAIKPRVSKKDKAAPSRTNGVEAVVEMVKSQESTVPHDLSLVFLANEMFKNSQSLPEAAILAFDDALMASALKIPTLPNRL